MADAAQANIGKYKAGFKPQSRDLCKTTPFKIVSGMSSETNASLGLGTGKAKGKK